jgi:hypothetical protein
MHYSSGVAQMAELAVSCRKVYKVDRLVRLSWGWGDG